MGDAGEMAKVAFLHRVTSIPSWARRYPGERERVVLPTFLARRNQETWPWSG